MPKRYEDQYGGGGYGGWGRGDAYGPEPSSYEGQRSRGRFAGRGPKGYRRSDERIRDEINDLLYIDPLIDASDIEVVVSQGIVTMSGVVEDRHQKRVAEELAESVIGVDDVFNQLKVRHGFLAGLTGEKATEPEVPREPDRETPSEPAKISSPYLEQNRSAKRR